MAYSRNRRFRTDRPHAGSDQEENLLLAHGILGEKTYGWHYDSMFILMNLVIAFTDGGQYVLLKSVGALPALHP